MPKTKVTVVIPTRERPDTLAKCLKSVLNQDYDNLSVVVSDNNSGPATADVVRSFADPRIRYMNTGRRISMSHNFEFALAGVHEGWIVMLGDDDGLLPDSLNEPISLLEETGLEALAAENCSFHWPSGRGKPDFSLTIPYGAGYRLVDSARALEHLLKWRMDGLLLPQLYTGGIVSAALYQRIRKIKGTFFQSQIPDIYSGLAICSTVDRFIHTKTPFAINGTSRHSNGAALFRMERTAFLNEGNIPFHSRIPLPPSGTLTFSMPAMVYECYLQSEYLHQDRLQVSPLEQLKVILTETDQGKDMLQEWALSFAQENGISLEHARLASGARPLSRRVSRMRAGAQNFCSRYRVRAETGVQIDDVYQASLVAATVLRTRPNRAGSYWRTAKRLIPVLRRR